MLVPSRRPVHLSRRARADDTLGSRRIWRARRPADAVCNPGWRPDGRRAAFEGLMADRPPQRAPEGAPPPIDDATFEWRLAFATELFSRPDVGSPIRARLPAGAPVVLLEEHGDFRRVRTADGHVGYVGKLAVVRDRARSRRTPASSGPAEEPPPLPWELERAGEAAAEATEKTVQQSSPAATAAHTPPTSPEDVHVKPPPLPSEEQYADAQEVVEHGPAPPAPVAAVALPAADATPSAAAAAPPEPLAPTEAPRRRGSLGWLRGRLARRHPPADAAPPETGRQRHLARRLARLVALLLMLIGLFEVLGWVLGLVSAPRPAAAELPQSPIIAAVRGPDGQVEVSLDPRAVAGAAGLSVVWIVLTTAALGSGAALPAAALVLPALGLATALNTATGLTPPERIIVIELGTAAQVTPSGPPVALRQASGQRLTFTVRSDIVERLPGFPPPARPRVAATAVITATAVSAARVVPRPPGALDLGFILDASGSMLERLEGRPKIAIAKEVLNEFLANVDPTVHVGLWVYGHRSGDRTFQCQQIELLHPIGPVDADALRARIEEVTPFGWTPLAASLAVAARDFRRLPGIVEILVLISDGEETCGGDPATVAADVRRANPQLTIHTVGLAVTPETRRQLELIAEAGGGRYYDARNARALAEALAAIRRSGE